MLKTEVHRARRAHTKELLVYTEEGDVLPLKVDRDESLAHFKKRLKSKEDSSKFLKAVKRVAKLENEGSRKFVVLKNE